MYLNAKKTFTLLAGLMLALVFVGTSCKKDEEKTSKDYITAHEWKLTGKTYNNVSVLLECEKDDIITYHKDGEYHEDAGATKCDATGLQQLTGNWSISASTTPETLTITFDDATLPPYEAKITQLDDDKLVLTKELGSSTNIEVRTYERR
jgi:hypothetical protein